MTSVRSSLNVVGQAASIKELAHAQNEMFPLSLRNFVGAPPPGRIVRKVISRQLLQRKFDEFFNARYRPMFKIRLHNLGSGDHRHSTLTAYFDDPVVGYKEQGTPKDLGQLTSSVADYYFDDVNSNELNLDVMPELAVVFKASMHFETQGTELKINNLPDANFTSFGIEITFRLELDILAHSLGFVVFKEWVKADVSTNAPPIYRHFIEDSIESGMHDRIYQTLIDSTQSINQVLTRWLVGSDFYVMMVAGDDQAITIDYIVPPGQLEPFPENPQDPLDPGTLANIDHIVVVMMENRSFDHMLGYLSKEGGRTDVDGLRGGEVNRFKGRNYPSFPLPDTKFLECPPHGHEPVENQINGGKLDGFVAEFAKQYESQGADPGRIMGYHSAAHVAVYDALAREFLVCQRWFAAHPGPTFCNRYYTLTGRLNRDSFGNWEFNNPANADLRPASTRTIFDHLTEQGISWNYYEHGYCFLRLFEHYTTDTNNIIEAGIDSKNFIATALAGALPSVTFIDPDFIDLPPGFDDDAPADIARGQHFIGRVVKALIDGPLWPKTLLVITYDEHGGFYDHVDPLEYPANPVSGIDHYGVRVPAFVISPWVEQGTVSDLVFDHTSIAKTIARRFLSRRPPDMGERMAAANDLSKVLRTTARQTRPNISVPPDPTPDIELAARAKKALQIDLDFKGLLHAMRSRYPIQR